MNDMRIILYNINEIKTHGCDLIMNIVQLLFCSAGFLFPVVSL